MTLQHDIKIEKALISCLLLESTAISEVATILIKDMFYDDNLGEIYTTIKTLYDQFENIDIISITRRLEKNGMLTKIGGAIALAELMGICVSSANAKEYAMLIKQMWASREMALFGMKITQLASDRTKDVADAMGYVDTFMSDMTGKLTSSSTVKTVSQAADESIEEYNAKRRGEVKNVNCGIGKVNEALGGGLRGGQLCVVAGRPGCGKTSMLLHFAKSAAERNQHALIFSLEMSASSLTSRLLVSLSDINSNDMRSCRLSLSDEKKLYDSVKQVANMPIYIDDTAGTSISRIKSIAMEYKRKCKCDIIFIDYLQLIDMRADNRSYNREQEVAQTSRACKLIAKELNVPVVLLSQLSRAVETRADKIPMLCDLRESGAIEQDADIVMFIHREEYYDSNAEKGKGTLRIAKQRDGRVGDVDFGYNESLTRIFDYTDNQHNISSNSPF